MPDQQALPSARVEPARVDRDTSRPILLVGFQHQGNLGLGYLAATLKRHGYPVVTCDVECDPEAIVETAKRLDPLIVGFSLIFQFYIPQYRRLILRLREVGIGCHFTMGGHFSSLSYRRNLELIPELDSVVRFEGELTLLELADRIGAGQEWRGVQGIAYGDGGRIEATPMRPLLDDLDRLPYPERDFEPETALGRRAMPLLASRGCARTCSFCSIQTFYRAAPGKIVRTRKPAAVVEEMRFLHEERAITIFLFQDDDFPLFGRVWRRWAADFVRELHRTGLAGRVIWKMNCRADSVVPDVFADLRDAGLYLVYMGLESGNDEGLKILHKEITVEQNLRAVQTLKQLGLMFEFGFMMFDPSSTLGSIKENLDFLRAIVGDGSAAAVFCRMLPYDGTPIKDALEQAGRLRGDVVHPEYDFLEQQVTDFYRELTQILDVWGWMHGFQALSPHLNWSWNEAAILQRLFPPLPGLNSYKEELRAITRESNAVLFRIVDDLLEGFLRNRPHSWSAGALARRRDAFLKRMIEARNAFVAGNQDVLMRALHPEKAAEFAAA
ncbi:MAG TPA: radical SAM protein [Stellaceae bacterium]|nr:radical SAM protein [Stellaceae bacterium]